MTDAKGRSAKGRSAKGRSAKNGPEAAGSDVREQALMAAVADLPVVLWTTDTELRMTTSGGGAIGGIGRHGERLGMTLQQVVGSDDPAVPAIRAHLDALEGRSATYEQEAFGRSWQAHVEPIFDEERRVVGVSGVSIDVTDRRKVEDELRESAARFRQLSDAAFEGIAVHDKGVVLDANASFCKMFGYELPELVGMSVLELAAPESRSEVLHQFETGSEAPYEARGLRKDGSVFMGELRGSPITMGGRPVRVAAVRDITERKMAEEEVRLRAAELAALNLMASKVGRSLSLDEVVREAVDGLIEAVGCDTAFLLLKEGERLMLKGVAPESAEDTLGAIPEHRVGVCLCGLAASEGAPIYSRGVFTDARCSWDERKEAGLRSFAALPLRTREGIIGVVGVASRAERDFEGQSAFLETLANQVAMGLQNALLFAASESQHQEVLQSESWLRALLSSISDVVLVLDSEGTYLDISSRDEHLLYQPADALKGKTLREVFPPAQADYFLDHVHRALSTQETVRCEYELDIEGRQMWFAALVSPMSETQVVWVARDVTSRKEAELALERGEAKFRALFEAGADAFLLVGADGLIEMVNQRAESLFGYTRDELEGQPLNVLVPEGLRTKHAKDMLDFLEKPKPRQMHSGLELWGLRKDGTAFPAAISLSYVTTDAGVLAMAAVTDETERKRAEDELRDSLERLRESDAERGRLLASLVVAQEEERGRMARELHDDAIQVMTAAELRVQTFALKDPASGESLNALGETIRSAIGRLRTSLVGLRPPILENVGVAPALRAHLETMREDSGLDFTINDLWETEPGIETRVTVYRIALEALTNVRKYAGATSVAITLKPENDGFGVSVRDNGKGFDTAAAEGTPGHMGLMIMRERAELAGGQLKVLSRSGAGTTVEFWIPDAPDL